MKNVVIKAIIYTCLAYSSQASDIKDFQGGENSLSLGNCQIKSAILAEEKLTVVMTSSFSDEERVTIFETPKNIDIAIKYLVGKLTPKQALKEINEKGNMDIGCGEDWTKSKLMTFFKVYHPGYMGFGDKTPHRVFEARERS